VNTTSKIYLAGHHGLVGSALMRCLQNRGYTNLLLRSHQELDLTDQRDVHRFFEEQRPEYVFLAAAKVGGIIANSSYPAEFIRENILIQTNVIHEAYRAGVKRLLFLGSSCIYPKHAPQPMRESDLLTGPLEETNRPYAIAKISGVEMCWSYNRQYGSRFLAAMPTNLFGPGDRYDPHSSHVIPALLLKMHEAKLSGASQVEVWGTGSPRREFLYSDDAADACLFLMNLPEDQFAAALGSGKDWPIVNIGVGRDISIREIAEMIADMIGFKGSLVFNPEKPDGTPRKLLDVTRLASLGWTARTLLREGLEKAYVSFQEGNARFSEVARVPSGKA
jgi:GDP-L-fucose synthase